MPPKVVKPLTVAEYNRLKFEARGAVQRGEMIIIPPASMFSPDYKIQEQISFPGANQMPSGAVSAMNQQTFPDDPEDDVKRQAAVVGAESAALLAAASIAGGQVSAARTAAAAAVEEVETSAATTAGRSMFTGARNPGISSSGLRSRVPIDFKIKPSTTSANTKGLESAAGYARTFQQPETTLSVVDKIRMGVSGTTLTGGSVAYNQYTTQATRGRRPFQSTRGRRPLPSAQAAPSPPHGHTEVQTTRGGRIPRGDQTAKRLPFVFKKIIGARENIPLPQPVKSRSGFIMGTRAPVRLAQDPVTSKDGYLIGTRSKVRLPPPPTQAP